MHTNHIDLIKILLKSNAPTKSKNLAEQINVSTRSIRNYIHQINSLEKPNIIMSSDDGYYIRDKNIALKIIQSADNDDKSVPQNDEERYIYLSKRLLRTQSIDAFKVADELYISFSTLKRTINYINKRLEKWNTHIQSTDDKLSLIGKETDKRRIFSYLIYRENTGNILNINYLEDSFGKKNTLKVQQIVDEAIAKHHLEINEFAYNNLLLHLLIIISRLSAGHTVTSSNGNFHLSEYTIELADNIERKMNYKISDTETQELDILLKSNTNLSQLVIKDNSFGKEFNDKIDLIIKRIHTMYLINLSYPNFIQPFAIHIYNLIYRLKNNHYLKNPIRPELNNSFPLIYDIATYVAFLIRELWDVKVPEDEISFIVLHIGSEIERQKQTSSKLKAVLIAPNYLNINSKVRCFIKNNFSKDITIIKEIDTLDKNSNLKLYDIIFSTLAINNKPSFQNQFVKLDVLALDKQKINIQKSIDEAFLPKKKTLVKDEFYKFFSNKLFWNLSNGGRREEILNDVITTMQSQGVVNNDFYKQILERESMGSTAFNRIALPHPMNFSSPKTKVSVVLSEKGIEWGNSKVNMVFVISISPKYKDEFRKIYENLMDFISDNDKFNLLLKSSNLDEFYLQLLS